MGIKSVLVKMYPVDKANHFMRGTVVAMALATAAFVGLGVALHEALLPSRVPMTFSALQLAAGALAISAVVGAAGAFAAGFWKERMDREANEEAIAAGVKPVHGVEVADWQFTAWGAAPVSITLLVCAAVLLIVE